MKLYQVCTRCVMDTSDPEITFDDSGICNHCHEFDNITSKGWFPNESGKSKLHSMINHIKSEGTGLPYDCILGLSGGIDSSYLAIKAKEWGLRTLIFHVDGGWNRELAVANIDKIINYTKFDLDTHIVNWEEMRDLQLSYLKAGLANQDVPQDHVFVAALYHYANRHGIRIILSGGNIATESIFPKSWMGNQMDSTNLLAVHRMYGNIPLKTYSTISFFDYYFFYPFIRRMRVLRPLNFLPYNKEQAIKELEDRIGWCNYGRKHGESHFTKLFQNHYLPTKFGFDKRRPHLSSLIVTGQLSRESALDILSQPLYNQNELNNDIDYFCNKMEISRDDFDTLMTSPINKYTDFPNQIIYYKILKHFQHIYELISGKRFRVYS